MQVKSQEFGENLNPSLTTMRNNEKGLVGNDQVLSKSQSDKEAFSDDAHALYNSQALCARDEMEEEHESDNTSVSEIAGINMDLYTLEEINICIYSHGKNY